jgi:acyl carrier protein
LAGEPLTFDQFCERLAKALEIPREWLDREVSFLENLAFDSLRMLSLGVFFEDLDLEMPVELAWEIGTVGDAYDYYCRQKGLPTDSATATPR